MVLARARLHAGGEVEDELELVRREVGDAREAAASQRLRDLDHGVMLKAERLDSIALKFY